MATTEANTWGWMLKSDISDDDDDDDDGDRIEFILSILDGRVGGYDESTKSIN